MLRIIAGKHKGRRFRVPMTKETRPATDWARETIFNTLINQVLKQSKEVERRLPSADEALAGQQVLDAFCGSGAFGLEALSRGAQSVVFLDWAPKALVQTRENVNALAEVDHTIVLRRNVLRPGRPPEGVKCSLFFIAPPWTKTIYIDALKALAADGWMAAGALGVIHSASNHELTIPDGFILLDYRRQGRSSLWTLKWQQQTY